MQLRLEVCIKIHKVLKILVHFNSSSHQIQPFIWRLANLKSRLYSDGDNFDSEQTSTTHKHCYS